MGCRRLLRNRVRKPLKVKELNDSNGFKEIEGIVERWRFARGGYPIPGILQSVRKRLIAKEL